MKVNFGSLVLELGDYKRPGSGCVTHNLAAELPGGFVLYCFGGIRKGAPDSWSAKVEGPWYSDSEPDGSGATLQGAVDNAAASMRDTCRQCHELWQVAFNQ